MEASMEVPAQQGASFRPLAPLGRSWRRLRRRPRATQIRTALIAIAIVVGLVAWLYQQGGFVTMLHAFAGLCLLIVAAAIILPVEIRTQAARAN